MPDGALPDTMGPMLADLVLALVLFYSLVFGMRRGFFKELVQTIALGVSISVARMARLPAGAKVAEATGAPPLLAEIVAVFLVWMLAFLVVAVVGRLLLKKLRGKGVDDNLDQGAEAIADAVSGDTTRGPVTLLTDPIASKNGIFYWSDKLLGGGLGLVKGAVTGFILFALIVWADRVGLSTSFAASIEASHGATIYRAHVDPLLRSFPEYRLAASFGTMRRIAGLLREVPTRDAALLAHHELASLRNHAKFQAAAQDPEVRRAWAARDLQALLREPEVRELLADEEARGRLAAVDWERVHDDLASGRAPAPTDGAAPDGAPAPPR